MTDFASDIFSKLISANISASVAVIAIMLLRFIFRKVPKSVVCVLWAVAAVRMVLPFSIKSSFGLLPSERNTVSAVNALSHDITSFSPSFSHSAATGTSTAQQISTNAVSLAGITVCVWLAGMIFLLIFALVKFLKLKKSVKMSINDADNVYLCDSVDSPFILGMLKPKIYLPSDIGENEKQFILAHEQAHLTRRDHIFKPLAWLILSAYWFNPLCAAAYFLYNRDIESACDEKVIKPLSFCGRQDYSNTLLTLGARNGAAKIYPLAFGEVGIKSRIKHILNYKKPAFWVMLTFALVLCAVTPVLFSAKKNEPILKSTDIVTIENTIFECSAAELDSVFIGDTDGEFTISFTLKWDKNTGANETKLEHCTLTRVTTDSNGSTVASLISDENEEQKIKTSASPFQTTYTYTLPASAAESGKYVFTQSFSRNGNDGNLKLEYSTAQANEPNTSSSPSGKTSASFKNHTEKAKSVTYVCYYGGNRNFAESSSLELNNDMTFTLTFGALSSYIAYGIYEYTQSGIKCTETKGINPMSENALEYCFKITNDSQLTYDADISSPLAVYTAKGLIQLEDGAVFNETH